MIETLSLEDQLRSELGLDEISRLKGGRTNRVWRAGDLVVKLYTKEAGTPLFENSAEDEWAASSALDGLNLAPQPVRIEKTSFGNALIYKHISGPLGYQKVSDASLLLGRLHQETSPKGLPFYAANDVVSAGVKMIPDGHDLLQFMPKEVRPTTTAFIHRDPVFTNFVSGPDGLRLVDWQCPGIGSPVEDLAHFISPGMNILYRGRPLDTREIDCFLDSYPLAETVEDYRADGFAYHWRMACYCAWQVENGNADYLPALNAERDFIMNWPL